jgi:hypothetical protein
MVVCILVAALLASGCFGQDHMSVYNGCAGSWMRITDGQNHVLNPRLEFGERMSVTYNRPAQNDYNTRVLNADGFRMDNNRPLGAVSYNFTLSGGTNVTGPRENEWNVSWLPLGCPGQ